MSSFQREPLTGVIRQENRIVGAICLPEEEPQEFIDQFNNCYGPLRLRIEVSELPIAKAPTPVRPIRPVGATPHPSKR
ncbi:MAG: hypothetical protein U0892_01660 [Pirellulales bacterium]